MDWPVVALIGLLVIAIGISSAMALRRGRALEAVLAAARGLEGGSIATSNADVSTLIRQLRDRVEASESELDQQVRSAAYLADLMGVGIIRLDDRGSVELANAAAHILLRRAPGSIMGRTALETFVDVRLEELIAAARTGGAASGEFRLSGPDGPILIVRAHRSPIAGVWVVLEDVSELRRLQQIRTEFVDNLSHELRTPLSTVSLLAETLAREARQVGDRVPTKMRDRIGKIEVETGHLVQMVNELLDLARIEGGGPLVLLDDLDLGRIAGESAERLRLFAERQGLRLVVDVPDHLPAIRGDEVRLGQVIVNLVHNALKFGLVDSEGLLPDMDRIQRDDAEASESPADAEPGDERRREVVVAVRAESGEVVVSVTDHGIGIARADQARIFERFYKVDRVRVRGGGTGLGLAIARHVIQQHGGRIWVESEEGSGSTFAFALPIAPLIGVDRG